MLGSCGWATSEQSGSSLWNQKLNYGSVTLKWVSYKLHISWIMFLFSVCFRNHVKIMKFGFYTYSHWTAIAHVFHWLHFELCAWSTQQVLLPPCWWNTPWHSLVLWGWLPSKHHCSGEGISLFPILVPAFVPFVLITFSTSPPKL